MEEMLDNVRDFFYDYKVPIIIVVAILVLLLIGYMVWMMLYNPMKIDWEGEDASVYVTTPTKLTLSANAHDKHGSGYEVKFSADAGNVISNEKNKVSWELPTDLGVYTLSATVGDTTVNKKVTVIGNTLTQALTFEAPEVTSKDSDGDGLTDQYETTISKTDPDNKDSDGDGVYDGDEIELGLNPLSKDSKSDGKKDSERELTYQMEEKEAGVTLEVTGTGNLTKTTVDKYTTETITQMPEAASDLYYLYSEGVIKSANIQISYDKNLVASKGIAENNLAIYQLNESAGKYTKIDSSVDAGASKVTGKANELGKFFLADSTKMKDTLTTELMFVIDNSGSMYSSEEIAESKGNDIDFKRVELTNKLMDKLKGNYKFGAGKFTFEYTNLSGLTENKEEVKSKVNSIKTEAEKFSGTYIGEALNSGVNQFPEKMDVNRRFLILLTDGKDTTNKQGYDKDKIKKAIQNAQTKQVKVITIGLGEEVDKNVLEDIANKTGGNFYYASNADGLQNIFEVISAEMNYRLIDIDKDDINDNVMVGNSGFMVRKNGFGFDNFASQTQGAGATYGMSLTSKLVYENAFPNSLGDMTIKLPNSGDVVKTSGYNFSINGKDLYEYKFDKLSFLTEDTKSLRGAVEGGNVPFTQEKKQQITTAGFGIYQTKVDNPSASGFKTYDNYKVDFSAENFNDNVKGNDKEMLKAIYRMDILKYRDEQIAFASNPKKAMDYVVNTIKSEKPVLLRLNNNYTVLATKYILNDINPNQIKLEVYDPNEKGMTRYIEVERIKLEKQNEQEIAVGGQYIYRFKYYGKEVTATVSIPNVEVNL